MNFLKKAIGLSMAMVMAFGGFAASAVRFINKTTGEFVEISCAEGSSDCYDIRSFFNVYSDLKHVFKNKYLKNLKYLITCRGVKYAIHSYLNVYSKSKHAYGSKYIEDSKYLTTCLGVMDEYEANNYKINNHINNNRRLREFFEKNEYKADFPKFDTTYWTIEEGNLNSYKKEAIVFNRFLVFIKEDYDTFVYIRKKSDKNLFNR